MADDDIIIEEGEPPAAEGKAAAQDPDAIIEELRRRLQASEAARTETATRARDAMARANQSEAEVHDSQMALVTNALETVKQNAEMLKANLAAAFAAGDFAAVAEYQEQIADNSAKKLQLEQGKASMEAAKAQPRRQAAPIEVPTGDPVEDMARGLTARSADWVRRHPEYARNPDLTRKMVNGHNFVIAEGYQPDTDAYFERMESLLGVKDRVAARLAPTADDDAMEGAAKIVAHRGQPAAAPMASQGSLNGSKPTRVTLSAAQREAAADSGMTEQEYAKTLLALKKEGKIN
jgi:hypothetical protein